MAIVAKLVTRHICTLCHRGFSKASRAKAHEGFCNRDPANRSCMTCGLFERADSASWDDAYPGCPASCGAGIELTLPMPRNCQSWEAQ